MATKRILVVFTGGTIGSASDGERISPDSSTASKLIDMFWENTDMFSADDILFEEDRPYEILSENLTGDHIRMLGQCVQEKLGDGYDGIIVAHGTDTIQYSAAALSYLLPDVPIPIMIVSSNYVLDDPRANGLANFNAAVRFICGEEGNGVFVSYRNSDGITYIHRGCRLLPHLPYEDDLRSIYGLAFGHFDVATGAFVRSDDDIVETAPELTPPLALPKTADSRIWRLIPYPGMPYPQLIQHDRHLLPRAILLDSYHSGTIADAKEASRMYAFAAKRTIPIFLAGANNEADYESVETWKEAGVMALPQASPIAMYVKLWMLISADPKASEEDLFEHMCVPVAGDIIA